MKVIAVNGSPRKDKNTAKMLLSVLDGAKSVFPEAETKLVHLYDYNFTGCRSCFACKLRDKKYYGVKCFVRDGISDVLDEVAQCDGLALGSPIYFNLFTGEFHSFIERLCYPYSTYEISYRTTAPKRMPTVMLYTMNWPEKIGAAKYKGKWTDIEEIVGHVFTPPEIVNAYNTYQFDDYSKYYCEKFNEADKKKYYNEHFHVDLKNAFDSGVRMMRRRMEQLKTDSCN
jgi:multimeric flavodoxin WrbA